MNGMTNTVTERDFAAATEPYRRELTAHCYRMLGSLHDAEDQVQETYLRAWRAFGGFEGRSSVRTWMYSIATRTCLTAIEQRGRRPLPTGLGAPASDPTGALEQRPEVPWLEPLPDRLVAGTAIGTDDPAAVAAERDGVRLAFVAALQQLTAVQRAVLVLRDVLVFSAAETAEILGTTVAAVNSALQRARAGTAGIDAGPPPALGPREEELVARYLRAFHEYDTDALVRLLAADVVWEMPPYTGWYAGPADVVALIRGNCPASGPDDMRLRLTSANGQPAAGLYMRGPDGLHRAFHLQVLDLAPAEGDRPPLVRHVVAFFEPGLFEAFGLPPEW